MTVQLPNNDRNKAGAKLLPGAILDAVEFLGIERPVVVKWTAQLRTAGKHGSTANTWELAEQTHGTHVVKLSTYQPDPAKLSRTIWHELAHAAQQERFANRAEFMRAYDAESARHGYDNNGFEIEARAAGEFADEQPLAA